MLKNHVEKGVACIISENVSHSELVLAERIPPDKANPLIDWMMLNAIQFFNNMLLNVDAWNPTDHK